MKEFKLIFVKPQAASTQQLNQFYAMIKQGGEVTLAGLEDRIRSARLLAFAMHHGKLAAIAALKQPTKEYIELVFSKLHLAAIAHQYKLELGYAFTDECYVGQGLNQLLFGKLIALSRVKYLFATTRKDNMRHILNKLGFSPAGSYMGNMNSLLDLYLYQRA